MPTYSPRMKLCATCERWGEARKLDPTRTFVTTASSGTKGECLGGAHTRQQVHALATCAACGKWPALRK